MKNLFFISILLGISFLSQAQSLDKMSIQTLDSIGSSYYDQGQYENAIPYAQKALELSKISGSDSMYVSHLNHLAMLHDDLGQYQDALGLLLKGRELAEKKMGKKNLLYFLIIQSLASSYNNLGQPEKMEALMLEAKSGIEQLVGKEHKKYIGIINELANFYQSVSKAEQSELLHLEGLKLTEKTIGKENIDYPTSLYNLASLYQSMGRYEQAELLYVEAKDLWGKVLGKGHPRYANSLDGLGVFYITIGQVAKGEAMLLEAKQLLLKNVGKEHPLYSTCVNDLAWCYFTTGRNEQAYTLLKEAKDLREKLLGNQHPHYAISLNNLAWMCQILKRYDEAESLYMESKSINQKVWGTDHPMYSVSLNNLAKLYMDMNNFDLALQYCLNGIAANTAQIDSTFPDFSSFDKFDYYSNERATGSLAVLLKIINTQYQKTGDSEMLLRYYEINKSALRLNERIKNDFSGDNNKLRVLKINNGLVKIGIETALRLNKPIYNEEAFSFAELNKSILLADVVKADKARALGDLPDSVALQELDLQAEIDQLKKKQAEAQTATEKEKLNAKFNEVYLKIEAFKKTTKEKYPQYYALKYQNITAKSADIQKLIDDETLFLEYFIADTVVYLFALTKNKLDLIPIKITKDSLAANIQRFRDALTNYAQIKNEPHQNYENYTQLAFWFYEKMLKPALNTPKAKNLIIVADGELGHLPFEVFLTALPNQRSGGDMGVAYKGLEYLIKKYNISYNYSATLWKENLQGEKKKNNGQIFAFAPDYTQDSTLALDNPNKIKNLRDGLGLLPAAKKEVETLAEVFSGDFRLDKAANEADFKTNAADYGIIHLAMHGLLNQEMPILSSLVFTESKDSIEDDFLEAWEISRLKLNADLVMLSACETGYGKFEQGEGVMSLARSFMYAGVPALVVSLWQVNDHSTGYIMQSFYGFLADGLPKDVALCQAKLEYLKHANGIAAHPAFWSAFIQLGDARPIYLKKKGGWFWWLVGGGVLVLGGGAFAMRRKGGN